MGVSRRQFLGLAGAWAGAAFGPARLRAAGPFAAPASRVLDRAAFGFPVPERRWRGDSSVGAVLRRHGPGALAPVSRAGAGTDAPPDRPPRQQRLADRFPDLRRHFVVEYYPWYATSPWRHWDEAGRNPPVDLASNYVPLLGAYDSRSTAVIEQHAKWMAELGAGAVNVSWWGRDSDVDRLVPSLMDVMAAHDIHVTFHLEPYRDHHAEAYAGDVEYLIREYGDRRGWDCFLLLRDEAGKIGPVFKSFRTILLPQSTDCHGFTADVPDYATDATWRRETDAVRALLAADFDHVTLLADSLDFGRTAAAGFDGIAIYDNFVEPSTWLDHARGCSRQNLVYSFNVNPGYDSVALRQVDPDSCYRPLPFLPGRTPYDWSRPDQCEAAARESAARIAESFRTTVSVQTTPDLANAARGFFLTYVTSFNEWYEGHQFEPMKPRSGLTAAERALAYHNPADGRYRFDALKALIRSETSLG
jgi:hypothetical protein